MRFHDPDFLFQFLCVNTEVIACAIGYVPASALQQAVEIIIYNPFVLFVCQ
jgi:hypothetical protein